MKALHSWLLFGTVAFLTATNPALAQTPPSLGLRLFAGVSITGTVGSVYVVQSSSDLTQGNAWTSLAFLQLPATNYLFVGRSTDEGPQTAVNITHGFWMGKYEVTQREYLAVLGSNPSQFTGDLSRPVETVSWLDATNYCAKLTQQELTAGRIPPGSHYRLPTEAEWEYAARAGTSSRFSYGDDPALTELTNYAWHAANSGSMTHSVGQKAPNPWGLYDTEGNVWEWCSDWQGTYPGGFETDPQGPASNAIGSKITRGGAWDGFETDCRSAKRMGFGVSPFLHDFILGFRIVLAAP